MKGELVLGFIHCKLNVLMAERGLNIQNVKDRTTLSRTTISNLYNNYGSGIQFDTLKQLCEVLNCQPGDLLIYVQFEPFFEIKDIDYIDFDESSFEDTIIYRTYITLKCDLLYNAKKYEFEFGVEADYYLEIQGDKESLCDFGLQWDDQFDEELDKCLIPYTNHAKQVLYIELYDFLKEKYLVVIYPKYQKKER